MKNKQHGRNILYFVRAVLLLSCFAIILSYCYFDLVLV